MGKLLGDECKFISVTAEKVKVLNFKLKFKTFSAEFRLVVNSLEFFCVTRFTDVKHEKFCLAKDPC